MTATIRATANDILNRVGVEVGLDAVVDPFSSSDKSYVQLKTLLNIAGDELVQLHDWNFLIKEKAFTTVVPGDDGDYDFPTDYQRMVNQTHWEATNQRPLTGPLTPQQWQALTNADITSQIDVFYRIRDGGFSIFPQPPGNGLQISYEYISRNWVIDATDGTTMISECQEGGDTPLFDRTLISRMLKVKFLEAKNMDTTKAQADLNQTFALLTGTDKGAPVLNAGYVRRFRFLDAGNVPQGSFGS